MTETFGILMSDWCQSNFKHDFYPQSTKDTCIQVNKNWNTKYKDCCKSTGDKTWDVSKAHEIGHWDCDNVNYNVYHWARL